jgi:hypothetical protein
LGGASTTERLNCRDGPLGFPGGYGPDKEDLRRESALVDCGEVGWWLPQILVNTFWIWVEALLTRSKLLAKECSEKLTLEMSEPLYQNSFEGVEHDIIIDN